MNIITKINKNKNLWDFSEDFSRAWYAKIPKKMKRTRHRATLTHTGAGSNARAARASFQNDTLAYVRKVALYRRCKRLARII